MCVADFGADAVVLYGTERSMDSGPGIVDRGGQDALASPFYPELASTI